MRVANYLKVNSNTIEFDVYIKSTGSSFILTAYQCAFSFNRTVINNGNLSFSYISGSSQLSTLPPTSANGVLNDDGLYFLTFASLIPPNLVTITTSEKKIGRFRLTNSNPFSGDINNLLWGILGNSNTILTGPGFSDITNRNNHINLSGTSSFPFSYTIQNDWNMISIPGYHQVNQHVNTWWQYRDQMANVYNSSYQPITNLKAGIGYWMKHLGTSTYETGDEWPAEGFLYSPNYPINGRSGWNYFGVYNYDLSVAAITTTPPGLQNGFVFKFNPGGGYSPTNVLTPGNGYLIFLLDAGKINLPDSGFTGTEKINPYFSDSWGKIIISDSRNRTYTLFIVEGGNNLSPYNLPPAPPDGVFDVRFSSGQFVEDISAGIHTIEMKGIEYPVSIRVENTSVRLQDEQGSVINLRINDGEEIKLNIPVTKLLISDDFIPDDYDLKQNYPNPFNPSTTIEFSIPEENSNVKLTVFNALGEKITELVNSAFEPGRYSFKWDAYDAASGLYIYELRAESPNGVFISTKKMILMK